MTLRQRTTSGVKWSAISQAVRQAAQLAITLLLARLLLPVDFGLVTMATVVTGFVFLFKDLGTAAAIVQHPHPSSALLSTLFWLNLLGGLLMSVGVALMAPFIGAFYREPGVIPVLWALAPTFFIAGFGVVPQALLERQLAFRPVALVEIGAALASAAVGVSAALLGAGVWSLVWQTLTLVAVTALGVWVAVAWRPQLNLAWGEVRSLGRFSASLVGFNVFNYFARNADYLLIGRFLGASELGYYTLAYRMMLYPVQNISAAIGRVLFPAFSQLQSDNERFQRGYLYAVSMIVLITAPLMLGLMVVCGPLVRVLFGPTWEPVIPLLLLLAPLGLFQSIGTTVGAIYQAKGRTDLLLLWGAVAGSLTVGAFVVGLPWGVLGVATAYLIVSFGLFLPSLIIPFQLIGLRLGQLASAVTSPLLNGLVMISTLLVCNWLLPARVNDVVRLALLVPIGIAVYAGATWFTNREQLRAALAAVGGRV